MVYLVDTPYLYLLHEIVAVYRQLRITNVNVSQRK